MGCIYMRTSPSGKSYIGQTSFTEIKRWKEHCYAAHRKTHPDYNTPLSRSIRKYGDDSFTCVILEDNIADFQTLLNREMYWISYFDTFNNGLNATRGGDGNKQVDSNVIIELWNQGYCVRDISLLTNIFSSTILTHLNMSPQEAGKRGPIYKTKNSYKFFGNYTIGRAISVSCFDMNTGLLVKTFKSLYEASKFVHANTSSAIKRALEGRIRSAFGYYWQYGTSSTQLSAEVMKKNKSPIKRIKEYVVCIETGTMYSDAKYAEKLTGICYRSISFACKGSQKTAGGFHWRYATDEDKKTLQLLAPEKQHKPAHNVRKVRCVETNMIYSSMKVAGEAIGLSNRQIYNACAGKSKTAGGYHWEYI